MFESARRGTSSNRPLSNIGLNTREHMRDTFPRMHVHTSSPDAFFVNSFIIEGVRSLVLADTQFVLSEANMESAGLNNSTSYCALNGRRLLSGHPFSSFSLHQSGRRSQNGA